MAAVVFCTGFPFFINREENRAIPLIGKCIQFNQAIFVVREDRESRVAAVQEMVRRCRSSQPWSQATLTVSA